jgi:hypothetical protein
MNGRHGIRLKVNLRVLFFLAGVSVLGVGTGEAWAGLAFVDYVSPVLAQLPAGANCGKAVRGIEFYKNLSTYSLIGAFVFILTAILLDRKVFKTASIILAAPLLGAWAYVNFLVDFGAIQKTVFNYNVQAEEALANIAEGQERYKSEHGFYLGDLNKMFSHLAGAHGINPCVRILELKVAGEIWTATAQHINSPEPIHWDGKSGSSLKKG